MTFDPCSATTQSAATAVSYGRVAELLRDLFNFDKETITILDYGAGLGKGTARLKADLPSAKILSYEPLPFRGSTPDFTHPSEITSLFDVIVCLNVLNVVPRAIRDEIVDHVTSLMEPEGIALIGTRSWKNDVETAKSTIEGPEEKSVIVLRRQKGRGEIQVFQKGFDGGELLDYLRKRTSFRAYRSPKRFAANSVILYKDNH